MQLNLQRVTNSLVSDKVMHELTTSSDNALNDAALVHTDDEESFDDTTSNDTNERNLDWVHVVDEWLYMNSAVLRIISDLADERTILITALLLMIIILWCIFVWGVTPPIRMAGNFVGTVYPAYCTYRAIENMPAGAENEDEEDDDVVAALSQKHAALNATIFFTENDERLKEVDESRKRHEHAIQSESEANRWLMYWCVFGSLNQLETLDKTLAFESYDLEHTFLFNLFRLLLFIYCGYLHGGVSEVFRNFVSPFMESHRIIFKTPHERRLEKQEKRDEKWRKRKKQRQVLLREQMLKWREPQATD